MTTLPPANLPPEAMPWARAVEKSVKDVVKTSNAVKINLDANAYTNLALSNQSVALKGDVDTAMEAAKTAAVLKLDSSKGSLFKNDAISTDLNVTIFYGSHTIINLPQLQEHMGPGAYLEWYWRREEDEEFGIIVSTDARISNGGFTLTVSPADVDNKTVFQCVLHD